MLPPVWNYPFTYREVKGSQLTNTEVDNNFKAVAERAEYAQLAAETLPNEIALEAASAATAAANQIASTAFVGEWVDLRPYLEAPFFWSTAREGNNSHPRARLVAGGKVELDGVVNFNEVSSSIPLGVRIMRVPEPFRPRLTTGFVSFADSADPVFFGLSSFIVFGDVDYSGAGRQAGDIALVSANGFASVLENGSITLNSACWYID